MSSSSSHASSFLNNNNNNSASSSNSLDEQIDAVNEHIKQCEIKIANFESTRNISERDYYRKKEEQLRKKEEQLREKELVLLRSGNSFDMTSIVHRHKHAHIYMHTNAHARMHTST